MLIIFCKKSDDRQRSAVEWGGGLSYSEFVAYFRIQ